ncbi:MAG: hormogonium polysaccharide biosynthesis protein HpsJ [Microcystaceae cyanobacterium]
MSNSALTALCLKLFGVIIVLSSLLDYATLAIPFNWGDPQWQLGFVTNLVDRGVVPLVGVGMILIGYWIDTMVAANDNRSSGFDLRIPIYVLSAVLGVMFLVLVPLHLSNLNQAKTAALSQIEKGAAQGQEQIKQFLGQVNSLSQNPQVLDQQIAQSDQVLKSGQLQGNPLSPQQIQSIQAQKDQLQGLRDLAKDPAAYKKRIDEIKQKLETQLQDKLRTAEGEASTQALKQGLRTGLNSLMLAIGYATVGALGLRSFISDRNS